MRNEEPVACVEFEIINGVEGTCLAVNGRRVAGPKPWGGGRVIQGFTAKRADVLEALGSDPEPPLSDSAAPPVLHSSGVPCSVFEGLLRYRDHHCETGGFLRAVLENDLVDAFGRADESNAKAMREIVAWCYNELPSGAWGSKEKVERWLRARGEGASAESGVEGGANGAGEEEEEAGNKGANNGENTL